MSVERSTSPHPGTDVVVEAPAGTAFADAWPHVAPVVGAGCEDAVMVVAPDGTRRDVEATAALGRDPLLDGARLALRPATWPTPDPEPPSVVLAAVSGPDAGHVHPLRRGGTVVGRHPSCDVVVADPDVSRRHCRVELVDAGAIVTDLGSVNGTVVVPPRAVGDGLPSPVAAGGAPDGVPAPLGAVVAVGSTRLVVRAAHRRTAPPGGSGPGPATGVVPHSPIPLEPPRAEDRVLLRPAPPVPRDPRPMPWLAALLPMAASLPLALWWGSPTILLFGLTGPVLAVGSVVSDRRDGRRRLARERAAHAEAVSRVDAEASAATADAADLARHAHPDLARVLDTAVDRGPRLWQRSVTAETALTVQVGTADLPGPVRVDQADPASPEGRVPGARLVLPAAPVTVDVSTGVAVVGPVDWARCVARTILGRLVAALPPDQLTVALAAGTTEAAEHWAWTRWLPHRPASHVAGDGPAAAAPLVTGAHTPAAVSAAVAAGTGDDRDHAWLAIVDGAPPSWLPQLADLGRRPGVHLVVVADETAGVPPGCRTRVTRSGESGVGVTVTAPTSAPVAGVADLAAPSWAERLARALAPVRVPMTGRRGLPSQVDLVATLRDAAGSDVTRSDAPRAPGAAPDHPADRDVGAADHPGPEPDGRDLSPTEVASWWESATDRDGLGTPLGCDARGRLDVDLVRDGPHALVAGTTGSGKSELLRSLVLGLACRYPPDLVAFLLVDFKGGATFADLSGLPHVVGTLTDLDQRTAARVLASLGAELRRREHVLAEAGVADLAGLRRASRGSGGARLPRLVVVLDEFRVLAEDAPAVLDRLVRLATVGRSLGVHLVLATQRPAGVVSADIRANTALRVALRVADPSESTDVVGVPDAATLPAAVPGRAVVELGGERTTVQTARAARPARTTAVRVHRQPGAAAATCTAAEAAVPGPDLAVTGLVSACRAAADRTGRPAAVAPWLPPLPEALAADDPTAAVADDRPASGGPSLPLALLDVPGEQRRAGLRWRPADDGPLLVVGGPRSGRSTTLASLATAAVGSDLATVVLSGDRGEWPGGVSVVDWRDTDHVADALTALAARAETRPRQWACVLVDDVDALADGLTDRPDIADLLGGVVRDAAASRVALAVTGGRRAAGRLASSIRMRLLLRPAEPADATLVGLGARDLPSPMPPGRCLVTGIGDGDGLEAQVLLPGRGGESTAPSPPGPAVVPPALPPTVPWDPDDAPAGAWPALPLGVGVDGTRAGLETVDVRHGLVVVGPPRSGRSTALQTLAWSAVGAGADVLAVTTSGLPDGAATAHARPVTAAQARASLQARAESVDAGRPALVLVDDVDRAGPLAEDLACAVLAGDLGTDVAVVAAGTTAWFAATFRGVAAAARRLGWGLLLHPGRRDARDVLGVAGPVQESRLPGRGVLVRPGSWVRLQVARVAAGSGPPALTQPAGGDPG